MIFGVGRQDFGEIELLSWAIFVAVSECCGGIGQVTGRFYPEPDWPSGCAFLELRSAGEKTMYLRIGQPVKLAGRPRTKATYLKLRTSKL